MQDLAVRLPSLSPGATWNVQVWDVERSQPRRGCPRTFPLNGTFLTYKKLYKQWKVRQCGS